MYKFKKKIIWFYFIHMLLTILLFFTRFGFGKTIFNKITEIIFYSPLTYSDNNILLWLIPLTINSLIWTLVFSIILYLKDY